MIRQKERNKQKQKQSKAYVQLWKWTYKYTYRHSFETSNLYNWCSYSNMPYMPSHKCIHGTPASHRTRLGNQRIKSIMCSQHIWILACYMELPYGVKRPKTLLLGQQTYGPYFKWPPHASHLLSGCLYFTTSLNAILSPHCLWEMLWVPFDSFAVCRQISVWYIIQTQLLQEMP